ncbi:cobalamin biosynthesis protein CobE [Rhizobium sp. Root73]|uniref:cobalamin biosynthesis protein n=1 Tax=unclassified Rhizobium TaxID=2613769 RepID=UPI0007162BA8|nr:cobalamin biosynthesis protein CobE [Rhizobium sp. Root1204]KQY05434.1 cobalamin biosynthesis protein CobE [Rhizobium sp. Root1334]KRC02049.1 cobalamin biosynthesis protein CobE [Rhizobium sp. Root73]
MHLDIGDQPVHRPLVLGLGCERGTPCDEVIRLAEEALAVAGIDRHELTGIASLDSRVAEPAMIAAARHFSVPFVVFDAGTLEAQTARLQNPSEIVFSLTGCHGVAEAAALAAAGPSGALIVPKIKSPHATAAIARRVFSESDQDVAAGCRQSDSISSPAGSLRLMSAASGVAP